jgi:rubrerythrin
MADQPDSVTLRNLQTAFAAEATAHLKYRYFAKLARAAGALDVARLFEETAEQEVLHAFGHLDLLYPRDRTTPARALELALENERHEYQEMYPGFRAQALAEGERLAAGEFAEQIGESAQHAAAFRHMLETAAKRFGALANVEERHASGYRAALERYRDE